MQACLKASLCMCRSVPGAGPGHVPESPHDRHLGSSKPADPEAVVVSISALWPLCCWLIESGDGPA